MRANRRIALVVNADDFGLDENRTRAILDGFRMGAITATTATVNMPFFSEAARLIAREGRLDRMGLHLNFTEGPAMTDEMRACRFFCDESGYFTAAFHHSWRTRLRFPREVEPLVVAEARAQMERFLACGNVRMHLDSHHHVHTDLSIARLVFPLAREYGFRSVRISRNLGGELTCIKRLYKTVFNGLYVPRIGPATRRFCTFGDFRENFYLLSPGDSVEVMVHPMYGTPKALSLEGALTDSGASLKDEKAFYDSVQDRLELVP